MFLPQPRTSLPRRYFMRYGPEEIQTAFPSIAIEAIGMGASGPTKRRPIFPPSHIAQAFPKQVTRCIRGPSVAPLCERVWRTKGTLFVINPRARKGAKRRGSCLVWVSGASTLARFLGGVPRVSMFAPIARMFQEISANKSYACGEKRKQETERRPHEVTAARSRLRKFRRCTRDR